MCLTSFPTQVQGIDDFNIDEYDSEYFENADFGSDELFLNDFFGELPAVSEPCKPENFSFGGAQGFDGPMIAPEDSIAMSKKRPASQLTASPAVALSRSPEEVSAMLSAQVKTESYVMRALLNKSRKAKKRRRRAFTQDDPRRGYVNLIFGAINTGEGLPALLQRITHPEVVMTSRFLGDPSMLTAGKLYREVKGREQICKFMDTILLASPDAVLRLHEKKMRLRQNNSSYVVAKYTLEGHKFCHVLTTNDKHVSKKALCPTKTVPAAALTVQAVAAAAAGQTLNKPTASVGSTSHDESSEISSAQSPSLMMDDEWSEHLLDELSAPGSPFLLDHASFAESLHADFPVDICAPVSAPVVSAPSSENISAKSDFLLQAWQFPQRPVSISGADQKVSVASQNTDFGLSNSLPLPTFVSSIGTMALHINPNRQIYKIDFLWTFKKPEVPKGHK